MRIGATTRSKTKRTKTKKDAWTEVYTEYVLQKEGICSNRKYKDCPAKIANSVETCGECCIEHYKSTFFHYMAGQECGCVPDSKQCNARGSRYPGYNIYNALTVVEPAPAPTRKAKPSAPSPTPSRAPPPAKTCQRNQGALTCDGRVFTMSTVNHGIVQKYAALCMQFKWWTHSGWSAESSRSWINPSDVLRCSKEDNTYDHLRGPWVEKSREAYKDDRHTGESYLFHIEPWAKDKYSDRSSEGCKWDSGPVRGIGNRAYYSMDCYFYKDYGSLR